MADNEVRVYGLCDANCRHQVLTIEQTIDLIQEMAANGFQVPEGYIPQTSVNGIVEQNGKDEIRLWVGTQAEYDALSDKEKEYLFAIVSDDPTLQEIEKKLNQLGQSIISLDNSILQVVNRFAESKVTTFGDYVVPKKKYISKTEASWSFNGSTASPSINLATEMAIPEGKIGLFVKVGDEYFELIGKASSSQMSYTTRSVGGKTYSFMLMAGLSFVQLSITGDTPIVSSGSILEVYQIID